MSHTSVIELEIKDLDTLEVACKVLGCTLIKNQKTYKWWGRYEGDYPLPDGFEVKDMGKCEHAIRVPDANWEIGVVKDPLNKKNYKLIYDFYGEEGEKIERVCGSKLGKFKGAYTIAEIQQTLKKKKAKFREEQKGQIKRFIINI
jgi:hypothetical protein